MGLLLEPFHYAFMLRALIAGVLIATIAPILGQFMIVRRYALFPDTLAHVSLLGIAIAVLWGFPVMVGALVGSALAAVLMEWLRGRKGIQGETTLALFLSGSLALAIVVIGLTGGIRIDLSSLLFGSITTVSIQELWIMATVAVPLLALIAWGYPYLFAVSFAEEHAQVQGLPVRLINLLLVIAVAGVVSIAIRAVGVLLIGALMVIPVLTASAWQKTFKTTLLLSVVCAYMALILGLYLSYYLGVASGGAIVLVSLIIFLTTRLGYRV